MSWMINVIELYSFISMTNHLYLCSYDEETVPEIVVKSQQRFAKIQKNQNFLNYLLKRNFHRFSTFAMKHQILKILSQSHASNAFFHVLEFLDEESLVELFRAIGKNADQSDISQISNLRELSALVSAFLLHTKYLNKVDRSFYHFLYEEEFVATELDRNSLFSIAQKQAKNPVAKLSATNLILSYEQIFTDLQSQCHLSESQMATLRKMVEQPDMPLPINLRSNIGKHCNTIYQMFQCSQAYGMQYYRQVELTQTEYFAEFKRMIGENEERYIKSAFTKGNQGGRNTFCIEKLKQLRFSPLKHLAGLSSFRSEQFIRDNELYNFMILVLQLASNMLKTIELSLETMQDPYQRFTELVLRYSIFRSFALQMEQQIGSIFEIYEELMQDLLNIEIKNGGNSLSFKVSKVMLDMFAKQILENQKLSSQAFSTYGNLIQVLKMQKQGAYQAEIQKWQQDQRSHEAEYEINEPKQSLIYEYLTAKSNEDCLVAFLTEFAEMFADLSTDQNNVLYNGHSQQPSFYPETIFEEWALKQKSLRQQQTVETAQQEVFLLREIGIKPKILRKMIGNTTLPSCQHEKLLSVFEETDKQIEFTNGKHFKEDRTFIDYLSPNVKQSAMTAATETLSNGQDFDSLSDLEYFSEASSEDAEQLQRQNFITQMEQVL